MAALWPPETWTSRGPHERGKVGGCGGQRKGVKSLEEEGRAHVAFTAATCMCRGGPSVAEAPRWPSLWAGDGGKRPSRPGLPQQWAQQALGMLERGGRKRVRRGLSHGGLSGYENMAPLGQGRRAPHASHRLFLAPRPWDREHVCQRGNSSRRRFRDLKSQRRRIPRTPAPPCLAGPL